MASSSLRTSSQRRNKTAKPPLSAPYHELLTEEAKKKNSSQWKLDRKLRRDYLSKRHRAFELLSASKQGKSSDKVPLPNSQNQSNAVVIDPDEKLWSGATAVERSLIDCCTSANEDENEDDSLVAGALLTDKVAKFVGILVLHCQDIESRSLALAILERTHELDETVYDFYEDTMKELNGSSDATLGSESPPPGKKARLNNEDTICGSAKLPAPKPPAPRRLMKFLVGSGMLLLSRWLVEASEPVDGTAKGDTSTGKRTRAKVASPTGPLLLPLLNFLQRIPFDRQLIMSTRINKEIRELSKRIDAALSSARNIISGPKKLESWTDPVAGGLPVLQVQCALDEVKESWKQKAKEHAAPFDHSELDPFGPIAKLVQERFSALEKYETGQGEKPDWWVIQQQPKTMAKQSKTTTSVRPSTEQMALRERQNERNAFMKEDLLNAQKERQRLFTKLREFTKQRSVDEDCRKRSLSTKKVSWKDGLDSKGRKRDMLEDVFEFTTVFDEVEKSSAAASNVVDMTQDEGEALNVEPQHPAGALNVVDMTQDPAEALGVEPQHPAVALDVVDMTQNPTEVLQVETQQTAEALTVEDLTQNPAEALNVEDLTQNPAEALNVEPQNPTKALNVEPQNPTETLNVEPQNPTETLNVKPRNPTETLNVEPQNPAETLNVVDMMQDPAETLNVDMTQDLAGALNVDMTQDLAGALNEVGIP